MKIQGGYAFKSEKFQKQGIPIIRISNLPQNVSTVDLSDCVYYDCCDLKNYEISNGELLIAMSGATTGKTAVYRSNETAYLNQRVGCFRIKDESRVFYPYLYGLVDCPAFRSQLAAKLIAGAQPNISSNDIETIKINLPKHNEQIKIASILEALDQRIETQKKIIEKYESLIRGIITDVNNGKIGICKKVFLRDILTECYEKNTGNHEVCSVSVSHGVINQVDYLGRSFAAKEVLHYNVVTHGDIIYTKSPTGDFPYGIVKRSQLEKPVAVSPLYGVYRPVNDHVGKYLHLYFKSPVNTKNYLHKLIQKGAKNTINITNQHFLNNRILIPEMNWLDSIVNFATAIEMKIASENKVLQVLQQQKDYLLSKMFI